MQHSIEQWRVEFRRAERHRLSVTAERRYHHCRITNARRRIPGRALPLRIDGRDGNFGFQKWCATLQALAKGRIQMGDPVEHSAHWTAPILPDHW